MSLLCWGWDVPGVVRCTPTGGGFTAVACAGGAQHSVAIKSDGSILNWYIGAPEDVKTRNSAAFRAVAAGGWHYVALKSDGSLLSWGDDEDGLVRDTPAGAEFGAVDE